MVGIARGSRDFYLADLADSLGFENLSSIQDPIRDLEASDLITRLPKAAQKVRFRRNKSLAWKWAEELAARRPEQT
jgi:predicted MarR family transcription regulator